MSTPFAEKTLANGLRIVCEVMPRVSSVSVGFLVLTGSRHENRHEHGVSHFLEHMCFKGTASRGWNEINVAFDELGSIYNAFTGKEHTVYFGWVPADRFEPQLELLADMMRPSIPPDDFETERNVILEEIAMSGDSFDHHVWNFLHEVAFGEHPLAHEILGEKESIESLPREVMVDYHRRRYAPGNMTLIVSGAIDPQAVFAAAQRYCGEWTPADGKVNFPTPRPPANGAFQRRLEQFQQQSMILLYPSVAAADPAGDDIEAFQALFGGANSRCYWNVVQQGVCSQAGAAWLSYQDCGLMALYADGEPEKAEAMLAAIREQARQVSQDGFTAEEVRRVRNRTLTRLALEGENPRTRMMQLVDDIETFGTPRTAEQRLADVERVSRDSIGAYLSRYPITGEGVLLKAGPGE